MSAAELDVIGWTGSRRLNESVVIDFSAGLDPLSVTLGSVQVSRQGGVALDHRVEVRERSLVVTLVLDKDLVRDPPARLTVRVAGSPSLHAVRSSSGAVLGRSRSLDVTLDPHLARAGHLRLQSINGRPADEGGDVSHDGTIHLVFDGVVEPESVRPETCPLFPVAEGLQLKPLLPDTRWSLVGSRCDVLLVVPAGAGPLELIWKRLGLRGLDGRPSEGPLVVTLTRT